MQSGQAGVSLFLSHYMAIVDEVGVQIGQTMNCVSPCPVLRAENDPAGWWITLQQQLSGDAPQVGNATQSPNTQWKQ